MPICVCDSKTAGKVKFGRQFERPEPQRRFTRLLQVYDKDLVAKWIWEKGRWGIFTKDRKGKKYLVVLVEGKDKEYRDICQRDLQAIAKADLYRRERTNTVLKEIMDNNKDVEAKQTKKLRDDVKAICKERWRYTMSNPLVSVLTDLE